MSGFHGLFSLGGILGAAGVSALLSLGAVATHRHALRRRGDRGCPDPGRPRPIALWQRQRRTALCHSAWHRPVHWNPLLHRVPHGRLGARLERRVPDHDARDEAVLWRARLCGLRPHHDGRATDGRHHRAAARRPQGDCARWVLCRRRALPWRRWCRCGRRRCSATRLSGRAAPTSYRCSIRRSGGRGRCRNILRCRRSAPSAMPAFSRGRRRSASSPMRPAFRSAFLIVAVSLVGVAASGRVPEACAVEPDVVQGSCAREAGPGPGVIIIGHWREPMGTRGGRTGVMPRLVASVMRAARALPPISS